MKKGNKFELGSIPGITLIAIAAAVVYYGYYHINKINAYTALVPTTIDSGQQSPSDETVLYANIDKSRYGKYDYIEGVRGELIVQLNARVPLYKIAEIADQYGLIVESRYSASSLSFILRIIDPGDDIGQTPSPEPVRIIDPGDDIGLSAMRAFASTIDISTDTASDLRRQGYQIDPRVKWDIPVSNGYLEGILRQLESLPDIYSVTLNTVK